MNWFASCSFSLLMVFAIGCMHKGGSGASAAKNYGYGESAQDLGSETISRPLPTQVPVEVSDSAEHCFYQGKPLAGKLRASAETEAKGLENYEPQYFQCVNKTVAGRCVKETYCTRQYVETSCSVNYSNSSFHIVSSNDCEGRKALRLFLCLKDIEANPQKSAEKRDADLSELSAGFVCKPTKEQQ